MFLIPNGNRPCLTPRPFPPVLSVQARQKGPLPAPLHVPVSSVPAQRAVVFHLSLLFLRTSNPRLFSRTFISFVALYWTCSSTAMSFLQDIVCCCPSATPLSYQKLLKLLHVYTSWYIRPHAHDTYSVYVHIVLVYIYIYTHKNILYNSISKSVLFLPLPYPYKSFFFYI